MEHKAFLSTRCRTLMHTREKQVFFLSTLKIYFSLTSFTKSTIPCDVCENFLGFRESRCYENIVCTRRHTHLSIHEDDDIVHVHARHNHFSQCLTFLSPIVVTMSTSRPAEVCVTNNSYQGPIPEDYDCPVLEDYYCQEEKQCDSELEGEDDGWSDTDNHRSPLLDLSYHCVFGPLVLGFMGRMDSTSISATCQFAIVIAPVDRETATRHVWGDQVYRFWLDEWCYVSPLPTLQGRYRNHVLR